MNTQKLAKRSTAIVAACLLAAPASASAVWAAQLDPMDAAGVAMPAEKPSTQPPTEPPEAPKPGPEFQSSDESESGFQDDLSKDGVEPSAYAEPATRDATKARNSGAAGAGPRADAPGAAVGGDPGELAVAEGYLPGSADTAGSSSGTRSGYGVDRLNVVPDAALQAAIWDKLGTPAAERDVITREMVESMTGRLTAQNAGITSMAGLQYATGIDYLDLVNNQISDLSPLSELHGLERLYLHSNQLSDLAPIAGLSGLTHLHLYNNQISEVAPLSELSSLVYLVLAGNRISDLTPLVGSPIADRPPSAFNAGLQVVSAAAMASVPTDLGIVDQNGTRPSVTFSAEVTFDGTSHTFLGAGRFSGSWGGDTFNGTVTVDVAENPVVSIPDPGLDRAVRDALRNGQDDPIRASDMLGLTGLDAGPHWMDNQSRNIRDLEGLQYAANLATLRLHDNQISDLTPLAGLRELELLALNRNQLTDLGPLSGLTNLRTLGLGDNQIADLGPLSGLSLVDLEASRNQFSDLGPLSGMAGMRWLTIDHNRISDLGPIAGITGLFGLDASHNQIDSLAPLSGMVDLYSLNVDDNLVSDLSPISRYVELKGLHVRNNQITDLTPIADIPELDQLQAGGNQLSDIGVFGTAVWRATMSTIGLEDNLITDLSPLAGMPDLGWVSVSGNRIVDVSPIGDLLYDWGPAYQASDQRMVVWADDPKDVVLPRIVRADGSQARLVLVNPDNGAEWAWEVPGEAFSGTVTVRTNEGVGPTYPIDSGSHPTGPDVGGEASGAADAPADPGTGVEVPAVGDGRVGVPDGRAAVREDQPTAAVEPEEKRSLPQAVRGIHRAESRRESAIDFRHPDADLTGWLVGAGAVAVGGAGWWILVAGKRRKQAAESATIEN